MARRLELLQYFLILGLVDNAFLVPITTSRLSNSSEEIHELESKLVEIKLPVKITSMDDIIAWAKNAMRSMASRIDITLASVDETETVKHDNFNSSPSQITQSKNYDPAVSSMRYENAKRPVPSASLVSTYANLLGSENSLRFPSQDQKNIVTEFFPLDENDRNRDTLPRANVNAYLPLLLDEAAISKYSEEALKKYYRDSDEAKSEKSQKGSFDKASVKYLQTIAQQNAQIFVDNDEPAKASATKNLREVQKPTPVISVPFEAIVTITRENSAEPTRTSITETRDPPDEFPPYFEKNYPRSQVSDNISDKPKKIKENSKKRQIATLGDLLRLLGLTKKSTSNRISGSKTSSNKSRKPSEKFSPPLQFQFEDEDQPQRQRRNETSQRQESAEEAEEEEDEEEDDVGSLGSIADLLPLVIPVLQDISDPNTETDLGEILEAAIPLLEGLSDPDDDEPDIIAMIGPILRKIIGGKDGTGSNVAAVLGPLITLIAPIIGPVIGPLVGPLLGATSNPADGKGSSLSSLITAVVGPLLQPTENGGPSPLAVLTAETIAALSKELKPGSPGGLDVGGLVGAILSGVIAGTSAGLSGGSRDNTKNHQAYGPPSYLGAGPIQAGSVNSRTSARYAQQGSQQQHRPVSVPGKIVEYHTIRGPYATLPQRISPHPQPRPPQSTYIQHVPATGPLQAGTNAGGSSYLPYGNNAVAANSANPIELIGSAIKDVLGAGVQVVSSVINVVFGIIGGSSSKDEPSPAYGPPPQGSYSQAHR